MRENSAEIGTREDGKEGKNTPDDRQGVFQGNQVVALAAAPGFRGDSADMAPSCQEVEDLPGNEERTTTPVRYSRTGPSSPSTAIR